ncbi:MAG: hypothetical protein KGN77_14970 [Xanthomonadaceae bacterium]|nr:hypothetical protein [Xanthomonadaceae bacterium]
MKTSIFVALALTATLAHAGQAGPVYTPIRPVGNCLNINQINDWHIVDDHTATVRAGRMHYVVTLQASCPLLGQSPPGLLFRPNPSNLAVGVHRICGEEGETVSVNRQPPCAIQSVRIVDKAEFDRLSATAGRSGGSANQPTTGP